MQHEQLPYIGFKCGGDCCDVVSAFAQDQHFAALLPCGQSLGRDLIAAPLIFRQSSHQLLSSHPSHRFLNGGVSVISSAGVNWRQLLGHRQVTDAYLLAVAVAEGGRFVSFDQRISVDLVPQARLDQLVVIPSA